MNDIERAISDISDIRLRLAASTRFHGYAPEAVAVLGLVSLAVVLAQLAWPGELAASSAEIAMVWGIVLLAGALTVAGEAISRSRLQHGGMASAMLRGAIRIAAPVILLGTIVGVCVLVFAPETAWLLPGFWQMLAGIVAFASYPTMPRGIHWPGIWYLVCGTLAMIAAGMTQAISPLMAGGPFVVGHLTIAWLLRRKGSLET